LLDVSPTALKIARSLYARLPVIGDRPTPEFLEFDGRKIPLPDASVDRVLSFDAFHHVANPDQVLREIGRVLKPGGIAGFAEPGARHSDTPMSQFEMRTYHVVENDIDIHALWRAARGFGFRDLKLALSSGPPFYLPLPEYEDFLAGGQTTERWLTATRVFLRDVRHFFLFKEGEEPADSRTVDGLACEVAVQPVPTPIAAGTPISIEADVRNTGTASWLPSSAPYGGVRLGAHIYDAAGKLLDFEIHGESLSDSNRPIEPGETVRARVVIPGQAPGRYRIELDCVASHVTWFAQVGSSTTTVTVDVQS